MIIIPYVDRIQKKLRILYQINSGSQGLIIGTNFTISYEFSLLQVR